MKSPYPPFAEAVLKWQPLTEKYKGEVFDIIEYFWYDPVTGKTFDNVDTAQVTIMQIFNEYRVRHRLPFIDELVSLGQLLNLSADKMNAILGLDTNQYHLYEKGDMPMDAVGHYIKMLIDNKSALKYCIEKSKSLLTDDEYIHAVKAIESKVEDESIRKMFQSRNKHNGYAPMDTKRTRNMIVYLLNGLGPVSPTFLNRILFYSDFQTYRKQGMAMSGFTYMASPYGPVPYHWKYLPLIEGIEQQESEMGNLLSTYLIADLSSFSEREKKVLDTVVERFKGMTDTEISSLSRNEEAWRECRCDGDKPISFDHAFSIKALNAV